MWIINFVFKISINLFTDIKYRCFLHQSHKVSKYPTKAKLVLNIFLETILPQMTIGIVLKIKKYVILCVSLSHPQGETPPLSNKTKLLLIKMFTIIVPAIITAIFFRKKWDIDSPYTLTWTTSKKISNQKISHTYPPALPPNPSQKKNQNKKNLRWIKILKELMNWWLDTFTRANQKRNFYTKCFYAYPKKEFNQNNLYTYLKEPNFLLKNFTRKKTIFQTQKLLYLFEKIIYTSGKLISYTFASSF